jgi:hypothetical protein
MIPVPQEATVSPLRIATAKTSYPGKTVLLYRPKPFRKITPSKPAPDVIPFDQWIMPEQEQGYIKCRKFDFL